MGLSNQKTTENCYLQGVLCRQTEPPKSTPERREFSGVHKSRKSLVVLPATNIDTPKMQTDPPGPHFSPAAEINQWYHQFITCSDKTPLNFGSDTHPYIFTAPPPTPRGVRDGRAANIIAATHTNFRFRKAVWRQSRPSKEPIAEYF